MRRWLETADSGSWLRAAIVPAQPGVRARRAAVADARHRRDVRDLQRDLRRAHRAVSLREARRDLGARRSARSTGAADTATRSTSCADWPALPAFSDVMATSIETVLMTGEFAPESFGGVLLSGNAFNFLGVPPVVGRTIQPTDIRPDGHAEPVVVLSHRLWLRLFEGSPDAIGRTLRLNGRPHTIVGVMPPRFGWYGNDGFWLPLSPDAHRPARGSIRSSGWRRACRRRSPRQQLERVQPAPRAARSPRRSRRRASRRRCGTISTSPSRAARCRPACGCCSARVGVPAADRLRQRRQPAARARHRAGARDGGPDVDRRRPPPAAAPAADRERAAVARRRRPAACCSPSSRSARSSALMPEFYVPNESRVAINVPVLLFSLGGVAAHRHRLRSGAGAADVEGRTSPTRSRRAAAPAPARTAAAPATCWS